MRLHSLLVSFPTASTYLVATPVCEFGEIRLQNGLISSQLGRMEVCLNGVWGVVCTTEWDDTVATVACRQLGYEGKPHC